MPSTVTGLFQQWRSANGGALEAAHAVSRDSEDVRHSTGPEEPAAALASTERPRKRAKAQHNSCRHVLARLLKPRLLSSPVLSYVVKLLVNLRVTPRFLVSAYETCALVYLHTTAGLCARSLRARQLGVPRSAALQAVLAHSCRARWIAVCGPTHLPISAGAPLDLPQGCRVRQQY